MLCDSGICTQVQGPRFLSESDLLTPGRQHAHRVSWHLAVENSGGSALSEVFQLQGLLPTVAFEMSAFLTVYPLTPSSDGQPLHVRVLAPVGYVWIPHAEQGWLGYVPNVTCRFCELFVTPEVRYENELLLPEVIMRLNQNFGFVVRLRVPTRPPTRSTNAFFLEHLGYVGLLSSVFVT